MELNEAFGRTVKAIRLRKGLPQSAIGINQGYTSQLESGLKSPTLSKIATVAQGLGIHPLTLMCAVYECAEADDADVLLSRISLELHALNKDNPRKP